MPIPKRNSDGTYTIESDQGNQTINISMPSAPSSKKQGSETVKFKYATREGSQTHVSSSGRTHGGGSGSQANTSTGTSSNWTGLANDNSQFVYDSNHKQSNTSTGTSSNSTNKDSNKSSGSKGGSTTTSTTSSPSANKTDLSDTEAIERVKDKLKSARERCKLNHVSDYFTFKWGKSDTLKKKPDKYSTSLIKIGDKVSERVSAISDYLSIVSKNIGNIEDQYNKALKKMNNFDQDGITDETKQLLKKIRKYLKNGQLKKAKAKYAKLIALIPASEAKILVKKIIAKVGVDGTYKVTKKTISKIKVNANASKTGATTLEGKLVETKSEVTVASLKKDYAKYQRNADIKEIEARRDNQISDYCDRYIEEVNNLDPNDPDYQTKLDELKNTLDKNIERCNADAEAGIESIKATPSKEYKSELNTTDATELEKQVDEAKNNYESMSSDSATAYENSRYKRDKAYTLAESIKNQNNSSSQATTTSGKEYNEVVSQLLSDAENSKKMEQAAATAAAEAAASNSSETVATPTETPQSTPTTAVYDGGVTNQQPVNETPVSNVNNYSSGNSGINTGNVVSQTTVASETPQESTPVVEEPIVEEPATDAVDAEPITDDVITDDDSDLSVIDDSSVVSEPGTGTTKSKHSGVIPAALGVGALGAAGVAGYRYMKNKKNDEEYDDNYDDEDNSEYFDDSASNTASPEGNSYQDVDLYNNASDDVPNADTFTDTEDNTDDFSEDEVLNNIR